MKSRNLLAFSMALGCLFLADTTARAQAKLFKSCVDELIDWKDPWSLTSAKFKQIGEALPKSESGLQVLTSNDSLMILSASMGGKLTLFNGKLNIIKIEAFFQDGKASMLIFEVGNLTQPATPSMATRLKAEITKATGDSAPKPGIGRTKYSLEWKGTNYTILVDQHVDYKKERHGVYNVTIRRL